MGEPGSGVFTTAPAQTQRSAAVMPPESTVRKSKPCVKYSVFPEDLTGIEFDFLKVLSFYGKKNGHRYWICQCRCGKIYPVSRGNLTHRAVRSCGCMDRPALPIRFWRRVDKSAGESACWPWTGGADEDGYGYAKKKGRTIKAHRLAWELHSGYPAGDFEVLHHCDNPPCCNPLHLFLGTNLDNIRDRDAKGRTARGEGAGNCKLKNIEFEEIVARLSNGEKIRDLANEFGVHRNAIYNRLKIRGISSKGMVRCVMEETP
jgi:hypothetical protein